MTRLIFICDPLCGECYAAAPLLQAILNTQDMPPLTLLNRAHFTGPMTRWMNRSVSDALIASDRHLAELSDQPLSRAYRDNLFYRNHLIMDSWPTAKAMAIIHNYNPALVIPFFSGLQQARFIEGRIISDASVLCEQAAAIGLQADLFHQKLHYDERTEQHARAQQQQAITLQQQADYNAVPCLVLQQGAQLQRVHHEHWLGKPQDFIEALQQRICQPDKP